MGLTPRGTLPSMRPAFAPGRNFVGRPQALVGPNLATGRTCRRELDERNLSPHLREFNSRQAHLEIGATTMSTETMIAVPAALVLGTAAVAMINYEANAPLAAFAPQKIPPWSLPKTRWQAATPMKHRLFKDNGRFITDTSLPSLKQQSRY